MLLRNTLAYLSIYLTNWSAMHAIADIRTKLFSHLQNLSLGFFNRASTGDLIARITNDTQVLYSIVGSSFASCRPGPGHHPLPARLPAGDPAHVDAGVHRRVSRVHRADHHLRAQSPQIRPRGAGIQRRAHEPDARILHRQPRHQGLQPRSHRHRPIPRHHQKYVGQLMRVIRANEIPSQLMEFFGATGIALVFFYVQSLPAQGPAAQGVGLSSCFVLPS
jgi:ABC-type multidrug transport system fused ATPase/permease subunit